MCKGGSKGGPMANQRTAGWHRREFLRGLTLAGTAGDVGSSDYSCLASMMAYVGLDPRKDIRWVAHPTAEAMQLLAEGKIDGFLGLPPEPQQLRARKIGHVVVSSMVDRPWSQYF